MKLNPKVTGGLAWAGLILILAVPSADMLMKPEGESASRITSDMDAIRTSSVTPRPADAAKATSATGAEGGDPVDSYLASGKKLPSYISDAPGAVASKEPVKTPKLVVPAGPATQTAGPTLEVASTDAAAPAVAPKPYPASMRPKAATAPATVVAEEEPLVLDEDVVKRREAAVAAVLEDDMDVGGPADFVSGDELEEWDTGSLAEYLERRGLMSDSAQQASASSDYDADGFFLDEGPNNDRRLIRRVRPREFFLF